MKEEPAWRRELRDVVAPWVPYETKQPDDPDEYPEGLMATLLPYIKAAEQRGFSAGVSKSGDKVAELRAQLKTAKADALREAADHLESIEPIEFALGSVDAVREVLRMAAQAACERCKGSGIDPEHSVPAAGPSYNSMGEPEHLEPCIACQFPDKS